MSRHWAAVAILAAIPASAGCGSSSDSKPGAGSSGAGSGAAGGATAGGGSGAGSGGSSAGSSGGGSSGSGGETNAGMCMERTTNHASGTRIRGRFGVTAEGDRSWQGWYDSERQEECSFDWAGDTQRCMPTAISAYQYMDAACSQLVAQQVVEEGCAAPAYLSTSQYANCMTEMHLYELGPVVTPVSLYQLVGDVCMPSPAAVTGTFVSAGAEVPLTAFVSGEAFTDEGTSRVRAHGVLGADGTRAVEGWGDAEAGKQCDFSLAEDGTRRCFPRTNLLAVGWHSDATCSMLALGHLPMTECATSEPDTVGVMPIVPGCGGARVVERGAPVTTAYTIDNQQGCIVDMSSPGYQFYLPGNPVPATNYSEIASAVNDADSGRLKPRYNTSSDGGCWFDGWYDSELDTPCDFTTTSDGQLRCTPEQDYSLSVFDTYLDEACSQSRAIATLSDCAGTEIPRYVSSLDYSTCSMSSVSRQVEGPIEVTALPPLWQQFGTTCSPYTPDPTRQHVTVGPVLDPTLFMAAEVMVE
ncbi:MAG TPA: hypothetical protein VM686_18615 [Polyangiaceae bacterium]|nr:hypothetical protein [Polyangiaceae bacterium]